MLTSTLCNITTNSTWLARHVCDYNYQNNTMNVGSTDSSIVNVGSLRKRRQRRRIQGSNHYDETLTITHQHGNENSSGSCATSDLSSQAMKQPQLNFYLQRIVTLPLLYHAVETDVDSNRRKNSRIVYDEILKNIHTVLNPNEMIVYGSISVLKSIGIVHDRYVKVYTNSSAVIARIHVLKAMQSGKKSETIYVPEMVYWNLFHSSSDKKECRTENQVVEIVPFQPHDTVIATNVTLQLLIDLRHTQQPTGKETTTLTSESQHHQNQHLNAEEINDNATMKCRKDEEDPRVSTTMWKLPNSNYIVPGMLLYATKTSTVYQQQYDTSADFYYVVSIHSSRRATTNSTDIIYYKTTPQDTTFLLQQEASSSMPSKTIRQRLPDLRYNWNAAAANCSYNNYQQQQQVMMLKIQEYHPNWVDVKTLLQFTTSSSAIANHNIYHIIGTQYDHHVHSLVQAVSNSIGHRYMYARGLAAAQYRYNGISKNKQQISSIVTTGGIFDQTNGIVSVFDIVRECSTPCTILFDAFDEEFHAVCGNNNNSTDNDDRVSRLWTTIETEIEKAVGTVQVVLVSSKPFPSSSIVRRQNLILYDAIHLVRPNLQYVQQQLMTITGLLYLKQQSAKIKPLKVEEDFDAFDNIALELIVQKLLVGRAAEEISILLNKLFDTCMMESMKTKHSEDSSDGKINDNENNGCSSTVNIEHTLIALCNEMDDTKQQISSKSTPSKVPSVRWEDIGGLAHVRDEIMNAIELPFHHPELFQGSSNGVRGIILYGPPGTGKTLVAKAVATQCGLPFVNVKGPELLGSYIGESEDNVRQVFANARTLAQQHQSASATTSGGTLKGACVLFFDELDSLAPRRGDDGGGGGVMDRVVATLFIELDRASISSSDSTSGLVLCMAATNRPDLLDPALLRPGRFDRLVYLGIVPDDHGAILAAQLSKLSLADGMSCMDMGAAVARQLISTTLTGADLSSIVSGALQRATERLCGKADHQVLAAKMQKSSIDDSSLTIVVPTMTNITNILDTWSDEELTPVIELDDLLYAAKSIVPSVTAEELQRYEELQQKFASKMM